MNELSSTEFRKTFAKLKEETVVTVNGRPIGLWQPAIWSKEFPNLYRLPQSEAIVEERHYPKTQAQRDELLRKINRSK